MFQACIEQKLFMCDLFLYGILHALYEILMVARFSYTAEALQVLRIFQHYYYILHFIKCKTH
jgi:hypothetical protein